MPLTSSSWLPYGELWVAFCPICPLRLIVREVQLVLVLLETGSGFRPLLSPYEHNWSICAHVVMHQQKHTIATAQFMHVCCINCMIRQYDQQMLWPGQMLKKLRATRMNYFVPKCSMYNIQTGLLCVFVWEREGVRARDIVYPSHAVFTVSK